MRLQKLPLYQVFTYGSASFLLGVALGSGNYSKPNQIIINTIYLLILFLFLCLLFKTVVLVHLSISIIFILTGILLVSLRENELYLHVSSKEESISGKIISKVEKDYDGQRLIIKTMGGEMVYAELPIFPACNYGEQINLKARLAGIQNHRLRNLRAKKINYVAEKPISEISCTKSALAYKEKMYDKLYAAGSFFEERLNKILPEPEASFGAGLVLGVRRNIDQDLKDDLSATGLSHVVALSGYNVTIIIAILSTFLEKYLRKRDIMIVGFALIAMFVIMTGASSSVVRASLFAFMISLGKLFGRKGFLINLMLLGALAMILYNPFLLLFDIGFQLSFLAFTGLILISPSINRLFNKFKKIPELIRLTLSETLSAQFFVVPVILYYFGQLSVISPISNLLVLWLIPLAMMATLISGGLGVIFLPLGKIVGILAWFILYIIISTIELLAKLPLASIKLETNNFWFLTLYGLMPVFYFYDRNYRKRNVKSD